MKGLLRKGLAMIASFFLFSNLTMISVTAEEKQQNQTEDIEVIENVDEEGKEFNPSGDLDGKKQFLTFRTTDNQTYHLIVTYQGNNPQAQLVKNVNEEDMEAIDQASTVNTESNIEENKTDSEETISTEEDDNEPNQSSTSWILSIAVAIAVGSFGIYRLRKSDSNDYSD